MRFNSAGSTLNMSGVTPPEFAILRHNHQANAGGHIVVNDNKVPFTITGEKRVVAKRDASGAATEWAPLPVQVELARLRKRYGKKVVASLFPGENPNLPTKFSEVGLDDAGQATATGGIQMEVEGADGQVDVVTVPVANVPVAPATDGSTVAPGTDKPTHLAIAVGDE